MAVAALGQTNWTRAVQMYPSGQSNAYVLVDRDNIVKSNRLAVADGDLSGTSSNATVIGLRGKTIPAPAGAGDAGKLYIWNGTDWVLDNCNEAGFTSWSNTWHQRVADSATNAGSAGGGLYAMSNKTWVSFSTGGGDPSTWANYPAVTTINAGGYDLINIRYIWASVLGGGLYDSFGHESINWANRQLVGAWTLNGNAMLTNEHNQAVWTWALPVTNWGTKMCRDAYVAQVWGQTISGVVTAMVYRKYVTNVWDSGATLLGSVEIGTTGITTTAGWSVGSNELLGVYFSGGQTQQCVFGLTYSY